MIPVFKPHMNKKKILPELEKILDSGWIGLGPKTAEFEKLFAAKNKTKFGVGVNSCTAALHLALLVAGVKEGDEVLVPSMTFASTALVALYEKAVPVFVDCDPETLCIDPADARRKVTSKTKALVAVHFGGHAAPVKELRQLCDEKKIVLIEDCAHSTGGLYEGQPLGSFGEMSCFSFHAVKNLPTADGGMVLTNNAEFDKKLRSLRWLGIDKDTWARSGGKYSWRYAIAELGYKYHMNDITAVIGLAQLETLDDDNAKRAALAKRYAAAFKGSEFLTTPVEKPYTTSAWHNYVVRLAKDGVRDDLHAALAAKGISTGVHYEPIHFQPVFNGKSRAQNLPVTEGVWKKLLTLPLYPALTFDEQDLVIREVKQFLSTALGTAAR